MVKILEEAHRRTGVDSIARSPDGAYLASGCANNIYLWDVSCGCITGVGTLEGHRWSIRSVANPPEGRFIVSGSADETICIWNMYTKQVEVGPIEGHTAAFKAVSFAPNGTHVASGSEDGTACAWDVHTGGMVAGPFRTHNTRLNSIAYSPDSTQIMINLTNATLVWCLDQLFQGTDSARRLIITEDGWIVDGLPRHLMFVPIGLQGKLITTEKGLFISAHNVFTLNFDDASLGDS